MKAPVLILTASFGEGHHAAARNLRDSFLKSDPSRTVLIADIFRETYGTWNRVLEDAYLFAINQAPPVWEATFALIHRTRLFDVSAGVFKRANERLERLLDELRPAVVISTFPGCNHLLDHLYRNRLRRPFRTVTVVTDSITINAIWHRAHSDLFLVPNDATAAVLRDQGVPASRIHVTGFPVPEKFASLTADRPVPPPDGRWRVLYMINSGRKQAPSIVARLLELPEISLTVTVGRDKALQSTLASLAERSAQPVTLHGWVPDMAQLMAENHLIISKAGGATVQESLAARTPMIISQIVPGQEEGNARLLLESGAGALAIGAGAIAAAVRGAFARNGAQWQVWHEAVCALSRPHASAEIVELIDRMSVS